MEHKKYMFFMMLILLLFLTGCRGKEQSNLAPQKNDKADKIYVEAVETESLNIDGMTKLRDFNTDLDADKADELIALYVAASRNEKGEMMWDDGQNWLLAVHDGEKSYPLLSGYVQLGQVYFTVSKKEPDLKQNITVIVPTGSSFNVTGYAFNSEKQCFTGQQLYESEDDNWIYNSIPAY